VNYTGHGVENDAAHCQAIASQKHIPVRANGAQSFGANCARKKKKPAELASGGLAGRVCDPANEAQGLKAQKFRLRRRRLG
jgi:hypothetical protein